MDSRQNREGEEEEPRHGEGMGGLRAVFVLPAFHSLNISIAPIPMMLPSSVSHCCLATKVLVGVVLLVD